MMSHVTNNQFSNNKCCHGMTSDLFDAVTGDCVDDLWIITELLRPHPPLEVSSLLGGQGKLTTLVTERSGKG